MKKVLIPVYEYYPLNSGGTFRLAKFTKYMTEYGYVPIVVAPKWTEENTRYYDESMKELINCRVEYVDFPKQRKVRKLITDILYKITMHPKYFDGTIAVNIYDKCSEICAKEDIEIIFASSMPQFPHWIANQLSKEFDIPWVADFRDLYDQENIMTQNKLKRLVERFRRHQLVSLEISFAKTSSIITTVSEGLQEILKRRFKNRVVVIMNGYDPDDFVDAKDDSYPKVLNREYLNIVYTGSFFGNRYPQILLEGLELLVNRRPELKSRICFSFFGRSSESIIEMTKNYKYRNMIIPGGQLSHSDAIRTIMKADILYFISHQSRGIVTGKIFEYLAAERPILSIPGDGDITDKIISETRSGIIASNPNQVADSLEAYYEDWSQNGEITINTIKDEVLKYTRKSQTKRIADHFDEILKL